MKKALIILSIMLALLIVVSCKSESETATLRIEMNSSRRTVAPDDEALEIYGYKVITVSPDGSESDPYYTYYSYINLDGLNVGKWKIKVYGFNSKREDLAYGEGEIDLIAGKNTLSISLDTLVGEGDLSITLDWSETSLVDIKTVNTVFKSQDGKEIALYPTTPQNSKSTITAIGLPAGSYTLQISLHNSSGTKLHGIAEAIRITSGEVTRETLKFYSPTESSESGSATITISDKTSVPVEAKIVGVETLIEANKSFTVAISIPQDSKITEKQISTTWYLDGVEVGKGTEYTFTGGVAEGMHTLTVMTSTGEAGSIGSQSVSFQAALSTNVGDPYQKITLKNGEKFILGQNTVMHFLPNGYLLIASNQYGRMQLVKVTQTTAEVVAEYTYDELKIGSYQVADFATGGGTSDPHYSVIVVCNSTSSCKAVNLIVTTTQITFSDEVTDFDSDGGANKACHFVNIIKGNNVLVATIENAGKTRMGYVIFNVRSEVGKMVNREEYLYEPDVEFGYSGFKAISSLPSSGFYIAISGQRGKVAECSYRSGMNCATFSEYHLWVNWDDYMEYYDKGQTKEEYKAAYACGFLADDGKYAFVLSTEGIYYYKLADEIFDEYEQYNFESLDGRKIGNLKMCEDVRFGYMIDNTARKLITITPVMKNGYYYLNEGTSIDIDSTSTSLDISPDGKYLIVYNASSCTTATLIKASR